VLEAEVEALVMEAEEELLLSQARAYLQISVQMEERAARPLPEGAVVLRGQV